MATIERSFRIFRQSIYDESLQQKEIKKPSGEIEIDEALYSVDIGRGVSMVWEPKEKNPRIWNISEKLKDHHLLRYLTENNTIC